MSRTKDYLFSINHPCTWVKGEGSGLPRAPKKTPDQLVEELTALIGEVISLPAGEETSVSMAFISRAVKEKLQILQ